MRPAQVDRNDDTPMGSVHKSRIVCMSVQLNRGCVVCVSILQKGKYSEVYA